MMKRPHVTMNMAMSVDGKVSSIAREPTTFTSREDKRRLMEIRSHCDALVVAARTAKDYETMGISNPKLRSARRRRGQAEHPLRVIVSGSLHLSPALPIFKASISPILIVCCETAPLSQQRKLIGLGELIVCGKKELDVPLLLHILATKYHVKTLLCEGGPTLNDAFFRAKVVDEFYLTLCPYIIGGERAPTLVDGIGFTQLQDAVRGRLVSSRKGRSEWFLKYRF